MPSARGAPPDREPPPDNANGIPATRAVRAGAGAATGARPSAEAVACALGGMAGRRPDAGACRFGRRAGLAGAPCGAAGADPAREATTKARTGKAMSAARKPRA